MCHSVATQTPDFPEMISIKLKSEMRPNRRSFMTTPLPYLGLELSLDSRGLTQKGFSFQCGKSFRRDEMQNHQEFVHNYVMPGIESWLYERCPMHRHGCDYVRCRLRPSIGHLRHDTNLACWVASQRLVRRSRDRRYAKNRRDSSTQDDDSAPGLVHLPNEVLFQIFKKVDSYTFRNVRFTCTKFADITDCLMSEYGTVLPIWKKVDYGRWEISEFRNQFTTHTKSTSWEFSDEPSMGEHLRNCATYASTVVPYVEDRIPLVGSARGTQIKNHYGQSTMEHHYRNNSSSPQPQSRPSH